MEDFLTAIFGLSLVIIFGGGFFYLVFYLLSKFGGAQIYNKYDTRGYNSALSLQASEELYFKNLVKENPALAEGAIKQCKRKHYALTHSNILTEADRIEKKEKSTPVIEKSKQGIQSIKNFLFNKGKYEFEDLDKLHELKTKGAITESEFEILKERVISDIKLSKPE